MDKHLKCDGCGALTHYDDMVACGEFHYCFDCYRLVAGAEQ